MLDRGPLRLILHLYRRIRHATAAVRHALRILYAMVWRRLMFRTTVIAITGSVGKTTAKECLAAILSKHARTFRTPGNANGLVAVPRVLCGMRPWHRYAVIEVGTGSPGQVPHSARLVRPQIAIELRVARNHANLFPTLEDTAREKASLLDYLPRDGIAILNHDDPLVRQMADRCSGRVVFFGQTDESDVVAQDVSGEWPERLHFTARSGGEELAIQTKLVGKHWVNSVLAAIAAAQACGVPPATIARALARMAPFVARMQPVKLPNGAVVVRDEETGSPDSIEAMVQVIRESRARRRILVFSDVEGSKLKSKYRLREGGRIAAELCDMAVFVGEHAHRGVTTAVSAGMAPDRCFAELTVQGAAEVLKRELHEGDLVFVKGRNEDHLSRIVLAQFGPVGCARTLCRLRGMCDSCSLLKPGFDVKKTLAAATKATEGLIPSDT